MARLRTGSPVRCWIPGGAFGVCVRIRPPASCRSPECGRRTWIPADFPPDDFIALDGDEIIGRVYRIEHSAHAEYGPQAGALVLVDDGVRLGPSFNERRGTEARRGDAG
jgi:hypothetical protein